MTANNNRLFTWGIVLLLVYPLINMLFTLSFFLPIVESHLFFFMDWGTTSYLFMAMRYAFIVGFLLIVAHHFRTTGREEKRYRRLDYLLILMPLVSVAITVGFVCPHSTVGLGPYRGLAWYLYLGRLVVQAACVLGWAYGIWRLRMPWLLFCSILVVVLSCFPQIPYNTPDFFRSITMSQENASKYRSSLETSKKQQIPDAEVIENEEDTVQAISNKTTKNSFHIGDTLFFLLIPVYTFMRWGDRIFVETPSGTGGSPGTPSQSTSGWVYATGETYLFLALPLTVAGAVVLSFLQTQWPLFTWNIRAWMEAGLVVLTVAAMALVFPRVGGLSPKRLEKADRGLSRVVLFLLLFPVASGFAIVYERLVGGTAFPASAVAGFGDLFRVAVRYGCLLAAVLLWYRGVQKKRPFLAVSGGIVFVSLLVPYAILCSLYPHVPFSRGGEEAGVVDDSRLQEEGVPPGDVEPWESDAARYCARKGIPWGTNPVNFVFFSQYISMHALALLLFTLLRFWADVFSRKQETLEETRVLT